MRFLTPRLVLPKAIQGGDLMRFASEAMLKDTPGWRHRIFHDRRKKMTGKMGIVSSSPSGEQSN